MARQALVVAVVTTALTACGVSFQSQPGEGGADATGGSPPTSTSSATTTTTSSSTTTTSSSTGAGGEGGAPPIELTPFGPATPIVELNSPEGDDDPTLSADMLEIFFESRRQGQLGGGDIYTATRASLADPWSTPVHIPELSTSAPETAVELSPNGLVIHFGRFVDDDIEVLRATRASRAVPWDPPQVVPSLSSDANDYHGNLSPDGLFIMISSDRGGLQVGLHEASRQSTSSPWSTPIPVPGIDPLEHHTEPHFDASRTRLWFGSAGFGSSTADIFFSTRPDTASAWDPPAPVAELDVTNESDPWLSPDLQTIYFTRDGDLHVAKRTPP